MKIDPDYLKSILLAFQGSDRPTFYLSDFREEGISLDEDRFVFHSEILNDQGFVVRADRREGIGLQRGADGSHSWSLVPLRLSAQGHEFIEALADKEVWQTIKTSFKDASVATLWDVSKKLLEGYAKKRVEGLLGVDL